MENEVINLCQTCKFCEVYIISGAAPGDKSEYDYRCNTPIGINLTAKRCVITEGQTTECNRHDIDGIVRTVKDSLTVENPLDVKIDELDTYDLELVGPPYMQSNELIKQTDVEGDWVKLDDIKQRLQSDKEKIEQYEKLMQQIIDNKFYLNNSLLHNTAKQLLKD